MAMGNLIMYLGGVELLRETLSPSWGLPSVILVPERPSYRVVSRVGPG